MSSGTRPSSSRRFDVTPGGNTDLDQAISFLRELVPLPIVKRGASDAAAFCNKETLRARGIAWIEKIGVNQA